MKMKSFLFSLTFALVGLCASPAVRAQTGETPIRIGDKLGINVTGVPGTETAMMSNIPFTVNNEGTIRLPHLPMEMPAAGVTPTTLARKIEMAYKSAEIYTNPRINVGRIMDATTSQLVSVIGEVKSGGGSVVFRPGLRILDAISEKGGFTDFGDPKRVKLIRGNQTTLHNLKDVSKTPEANVELRPEDRVIVPQAGIIPGF
jgi:protein involved in polysaccharide export with SLBB domain